MRKHSRSPASSRITSAFAAASATPEFSIASSDDWYVPFMF